MDRAAHVNVTHWDDVEAEVVEVGELRLRRWALGEAAGAFRAGVSRVRIEPGGRSSPAHCHGRTGLTYLAWGTRDPADLVYYPTSNKLGIRGLKFRVEPLDHWDGE